MNHQELVRHLKIRVNESSQKEVAGKLGVSPQYLNDVLNNRRMPGMKILKPLGLRKDVRYI